MRTHLATVVGVLGVLPLLVGCGAGASSYVRSDDTTLGRVVLYRNGVAYFERTAEVKDDTLKLAVPADKVDDFLKSLTVVDAATGKAAPIAYPTDVPREGSGLIEMKIRLPENGPHKLRLSYVTEAPAWKPSYRVVIGEGGKIEIQGWAIVDNTSGEDWNQVRLGVGSSSALSFRFDLRSIRTVQRETLQADGLFAIAPPTGASSFGGKKGGAVMEFSDDAIASLDAPAPSPPSPAEALSMSASNAARTPTPSAPKPQAVDRRKRAADNAGGYPAQPSMPGVGGGMGAGSVAQIQQQQQETQKVAQLANALRNNRNQIVVEGYAGSSDGDKKSASLERANKLRDQLVRQGVDPSRVVAIGRADITQPRGGARVVEEAAPTTEKEKDGTKTAGNAPPVSPLQTDPIGTSHFESAVTMTVPKASSAMVSILSTKTEGSVVYLYDPESARGNANFAFKSVRLVNPTDSVLESGPVTVFGQGRFIGEGLSEPIPARSTAFVPFALDRQVVVERKDAERDEVARILTVQRGVFSTEVKHIRRAQFAVHNRLGERVVVFVRHTVGQGYTIEKAPEEKERMGAAHLFRVEVEPHASKDVVIETATPIMKSLDLRSPASFETVRVYLSAAAVGPLKERVAELTKLQTEIANVEQRIRSSREQMNEYRARLDELHAQIVTLKAVKSAGPLMQSLEKKMQETSDRVSKATIELVGHEEKLMVARIKFQDGVAELSLDDGKDGKKEEPAKKAEPTKAEPAKKVIAKS